MRKKKDDVTWVGSLGVPYNHDENCFLTYLEIRQQAMNICDSVNIKDYDIISLHYGNLEVEQLVPLILSGSNHPPIVYHCHTLRPTLFEKHVDMPNIQEQILKTHYSFGCYVFFGKFAYQYFNQNGCRINKHKKAWLPTTITQKDFENTFQQASGNKKKVSLYGFAAPWKDIQTFLNACESTEIPFNFELHGPFWDDESQSGFDLSHPAFSLNQPQIKLNSSYVDSSSRCSLINKSHLGLFPYKSHPSFQGSGAIADYLALGKPIIASDIANMAELIGDAGIVFPAGDSKKLAAAIDYALSDNNYHTLEKEAKARAHMFTPAYHVQKCLNLYKEITMHQVGYVYE